MFYFLDKGGKLTFRIFPPPANSRYWVIDSHDRGSQWRVLVEGLAAGASRKQVKDLMKEWGLDWKELLIYRKKFEEWKVEKFLEEVVGRKGEKYVAA